MIGYRRRKQWTIVCGAIMFAVSLIPNFGEGAGFMYFKDSPIVGEVTDPAFEGWIEISSISHSILRTEDPSSPRTSSVGFGAIVCAKEIDKATPKLLEAIAKGVTIPEVDIHLTRRVGDRDIPYLEYKLYSVKVTSYSVNGSGLDDGSIPTETLSLNFEEIKVTYNVLSERGDIVEPIDFQFRVVETQ